MAGVQGSALAAAVCNAGGLGSLPCAMLTAQQLHNELTALQQATSRPYNVNFFCHVPPQPDAAGEARWRTTLGPYYAEFGLDSASIPSGPGRTPFTEESAAVLEAFRPAVVSFHFGLPSPALLARVKSWGATVLSSATTVEEALWLQANGADAIIAQGLEAGGHRGMFLTRDLRSQQGIASLLPAFVQAVDLPVIAAGGINDPHTAAAALRVGASAVQVGSAYMLCPEATTSALHRAAIQSPAAAHTELTNLFTGRPARGIVNRVMRDLGPINDAAPEFPLATSAMAPLRALAESRGLTDFSPLWCGQGSGERRVMPAADLTRWLASALPHL